MIWNDKRKENAMSNKLRKKDHTFDFVKVRATKEEKEDKGYEYSKENDAGKSL